MSELFTSKSHQSTNNCFFLNEFFLKGDNMNKQEILQKIINMKINALKIYIENKEKLKVY